MSARARRCIPAAAWPLVALATACAPSGANTPPPMPPAEVYDQIPDFVGVWQGAVGEFQGTLQISSYGKDGVYRGVYTGEADLLYILKLEQSRIDEDGESRLTNRTIFTWQDEHGGVGSGWLLIDRDGGALTGAFGEGGGRSAGRWSFSRV